MQPNRLLHAALFSLCFMAMTTVSLAQSNTQVIYTGKLMGYFRTPNDQKKDSARGCRASDEKSKAAISFKELRDKNPNAVLVGAGDNFAPQLEARIFSKDPAADKNGKQDDKYEPGNKELYYWSEDYKKWIYFEDLDKPDNRNLKADLALGRATIPTDNVGCFLAGAGFAAVVPGKHDFYFGPERVRELARFMASLSADAMEGYEFDKDYRPPQMLGANLVIKTSQTETPSPVTSKPKSEWPAETSIKSLGDGKSVYPWFSSIVRVQLPAPSSLSIARDVKDQFRRHEHGDRELFEKFLLDKIKNPAAPDYDDWNNLHKALDQKQNVWICPPQRPNAEMPCEGGWQIGEQASLANFVPASEKVKAKISQWFIANRTFFAPERFQTFLDDSLKGAKPDDADAWRNLSKGFRQLDEKKIHVCPTNKFNEVAADCPAGWPVQKVGSFTQDDGGISLSFRVVPSPNDWPKDKPIPVLEPGWNYGLCQLTAASKKDDTELASAKDGIETKCQTFSVLRPFLSFSHTASMTGPKYKDPDAFVFIRPSKPDPRKEVAIFGVVDPAITQHIGVLNYSWANGDDKLKTVVSAENPAEALKEQLDYFDLWYETANGHPFAGLKVLLAQMSPQQAKVLAARFKKFQLVVSEADQEQATSEAMLTTEWRQDGPAGAFIAVPAPYYARDQKKEIEGTVHFGTIEAQAPAKAADPWKLKSIDSTSDAVTEDSMEPKDLAKAILHTLDGCVPPQLLNAENPPKPADVIKWATLCAMRDRLHADVALIQKRDVFDRVPLSTNTAEIQQLLDRMIWKGDLLTLMYVPGSALKKSLEQSKKYDNDDSDKLSLANEKLRGLEFLGIQKNDKGEYLINEAPLDDKKIYAVATTDYIGAGDTGYPDLANAALDPKTRASQFPYKLESISAVVCRKFYLDYRAATTPPPRIDPRTKCIGEIDREKYLDEIAVAAAPAPRPAGFGAKFWNLFPLKFADKVQPAKNVSANLNQRVQGRPIWMLSLKNFSFSFNGLNNNDTDISIDNKYGGNSTSGVNAHENHTITVGLDLRGVRSTHSHDWFAGMGIDYKSNSTDTSSLAPHVTQSTNRLTTDLGFLWNLSGGRSAVRWGPVFTLRAETQLAPPFTRFDLSSSTTIGERTFTDQLELPRGRSVMVMPRFGLRHQNRTNMFEAGFEKGKEYNVLMGYEFVTNGVSVVCTPQANKSIDKCIKDGIKEKKITKDSQVFSAHEDRPRMGFYWKWNASIQLHEKVKWELSDEGDWYFADPRMDLLTDTRFRDIFKTSLKFQVFPNFSIGPKLDLLLYRNQKGLDDKFQPIGFDFLSQKTFGFEASYSFNWFNRRESGVQLKSKP